MRVSVEHCPVHFVFKGHLFKLFPFVQEMVISWEEKARHFHHWETGFGHFLWLTHLVNVKRPGINYNAYCFIHTFWGGRRSCHFTEFHLFMMQWTSSWGLKEDASIRQESGKFPVWTQNWGCDSPAGVRKVTLLTKSWAEVYLWSGWCRPLRCGSHQDDRVGTLPTPSQTPAGFPAGPPARH